MSKHTPGPHRAVGIGSEGYMIVTDDPSRPKHRRKLADVRSGEWEELRANAHLFAAADQLRNALIGLGAMPDGYCFCRNHRDPKKPDNLHTGECLAARAAIAKAEGNESEPADG